MNSKKVNVRRWATTARAEIPELWPAVRSCVETGLVQVDHPALDKALGNLQTRGTPIRRLVPVLNVLLVLLVGSALYMAVTGQVPFRGTGGFWKEPRIVQIASGDAFIAALDSRGRVQCAGDSVFKERIGQEEWWSTWTGLTAIDAGGGLAIGLKKDGTVVYYTPAFSGLYDSNSKTMAPNLPLDLSSWTDIVQVSAGPYHLVGLRADGTVVMKVVPKLLTSVPMYEEVISSLTDIVQVSAGTFLNAFLRSDGTVVVTGNAPSDVVEEISKWSGIQAISAGDGYTMGLKRDGTVVWAGRGYRGGLYDIWEWTDIIAISAGGYFAAGLKSDGTVVVTGVDEVKQAVSSWTDVVAISNGGSWLAALQSDGTVLTTSLDMLDEVDSRYGVSSGVVPFIQPTAED